MKKPRNLKEALAKKLTKKQFEILPRSFDVVGDIAIYADFPKELEKKEKLIAETLLDINNNLKVVTKKTKKYSGKFRTPKLKILAGERRKTTQHKENSCRLNLHVESCYFSGRTATERKRINELVRKDESVLIMFSGVAPFVCNIAKNTKAKDVYGMEINPAAHKFAEENIKLNKLTNAKLYKGDVRKIMPKLGKKFDRIAMPLPKGAELFFPLALKYIKKNGMIHMYWFLDEADIGAAKQKIKDMCKAARKKCRIQKPVRCGQYGPAVYRLCFDIKIL